MSTETNELINYLLQISNRSANGSIPWAQINPSTFQWIEPDEDMVINIQKAINPSLEATAKLFQKDTPASSYTSFLFQVINRSTGQAAIVLSSKDRPELFPALQKVFSAAEKGMDIRASGILKRLLK